MMHMDCLNKFQFYILQGVTFTTAGSTLSTYTSGTNIVFTAERGLPSNNFTVQGFKNINLYGIKLSLTLINQITNSDQGIIDDYNFGITFTGQIPSISGVFSPNGLSINSNKGEVYLGKYNNHLMFAEPIKSCNNIVIESLGLQGYSPQSLTSLSLYIKGNIIFFYKYEGEDED